MADDKAFPIHTTVRMLLGAAVPLSGVYLADLAMEATDTAMVGHLSARSIAAVGLGGSIMLIYAAFVMTLASCAGALMAERKARGSPDGVAQVVQHSALAAVLLALPAPAIAVLVSPLLRWTGQDIELAGLAGQYALALSSAMLPWAVYSILDYYVTTYDRPAIAMVFSWIGVALNALGNYTLIYGNFGFPKLGVVGAGLATGIMSFAICVALALFVASHRDCRPVPIFRRLHPFDRTILAELFRMQLPRGMAGASDLLFGTCLAVLLGRISADFVAASQLSLSIGQFVYTFISGLGLTVSLKIAEVRVLGDAATVRRIVLVGQAIGIAAMAVLLLMCVVANRPLIALFLDTGAPQNAIAAGLAAPVLAIVALSRIPLAISSLSFRALTGLKDSGLSSSAFMASQWLIALPLGLALTRFTALGGFGLLWGEIAGLVAAALFNSIRLWSVTERLSLSSHPATRAS